MTPEAEQLAFLTAAKEKGIESGCVRDAAHEAHHALTVDLKPPWTRDRIHRALEKRFFTDHRGANLWNLWIHEMEARAVEQLVCKALDYETASLEEWIFTSMREAVEHRLQWSGHDTALRIAKRFLKEPETQKCANLILSLGGKRAALRKTKARNRSARSSR